MSESEHRFPCDQCGADLRFDPASGDLVCDHCGNHDEISAGFWTPDIRELDFRDALKQQSDPNLTEVKRVTTCPNCGAQMVFDASLHADECPFCATPVVTDTGQERQIKPKALVPFAIDETAARGAMTDWLGRLWFAPNGLQSYARKGRRLRGVYLPYWTYDADTRSAYRGERGTVYYETRTVRRGGETQRVRVQKIRWRPASGRVARFFDDVLVLAATSLPRRFTDGVAPWQLGGLEPYRPEYLAGFQSEAYSVPIEEGFEQARIHMDRMIARDVKFDIGGDRQRIHAIDTRFGDITFKHVLLPVWMAAYKYRGKSYRFVVNGQTGRVMGERPWSVWKLGLAIAAAALVAAGIGYVLATQQNAPGFDF